jgi:hypothetical protein
MAKRERISYEEMEKIHNYWIMFDKSGKQTEVFKKHGWSRLAFFEEATKRENEQK